MWKEQDKYIKVRITIQDNGVGISPENMKKLFCNYGKLAEHDSINPSGTGLGLSICKKLVTQMGGDIKVRSTVGKGTCFIVTLSVRATDLVLDCTQDNDLY